MVPVSEKVDGERVMAEGQPGKEFFVKIPKGRRRNRDQCAEVQR
jgi:hypothetical protein